MASNPDEQNGVTRRDFTTRVGAAAAGLVVGGELLGGRVQAASAAGRILGANDKVVVSQIGIRGQGNSLKRGFAQLKNVEIKTLCDIDENLAPSRINDERLKDVATFKPNFVQDLRRVLDDKDIDAIVIAIPNHWACALANDAGLQAGKHVYVEKPASHTVWEGRRMVEQPARFKKIVQVGTMNRSRPAIQQAIKFMKDGGIGKVYMARGLCFKPRPSIGKYPDGPMAADAKFKLNVEATTNEPTYHAQYLSKVNYDLWIGPAPKRPFNPNRFHYNWHWHWDYGNGDTGNQGPHQFDIARWGLGKQEHPVKVCSMGGYFGSESSQETPDMQTALFDTPMARSSNSARAASTRTTKAASGSATFSTARRAGCGPRNQGACGSRTWDRSETRTRKGRVLRSQTAEAQGLTTIEFAHYQNFIDAIRANDSKMLACDIMEGHLSSTLPHLANISYRVGHGLTFNGKTETFENDEAADKLLTREYRKGFEIPSLS